MGPRTKTANSFTFNQPTPRPFTERAPTPHARTGRAGATKQVSSSRHTLLCAGPSVEVAITLELAARSALPGAAPLCKHMSLELNLICQFPCSSQAALASGPSQGASLEQPNNARLLDSPPARRPLAAPTHPRMSHCKNLSNHCTRQHDAYFMQQSLLFSKLRCAKKPAGRTLAGLLFFAERRTLLFASMDIRRNFCKHSLQQPIGSTGCF